MRKLIVVVLAITLTAAALAVPALGSGQKVKNVKVGDNFFQPSMVKIKKGTKVKWTWTGMNMHNVTVTSGPSMFHSNTQSTGTYGHTFKHKGTWHLMCTIHGFTMTVKVS
jgi:plastocyanin